MACRNVRATVPSTLFPIAQQPVGRGREKDIDEVLQTDRVFVNVSQGEFAKKADLVKAFGMDDEVKVCLEVRLAGSAVWSQPC